MKKYLKIVNAMVICPLCFSIMFMRNQVHAEEALSMVKISNEEFNEIRFTKEEQHGIIEHFDASEQGMIATSLNGYKVNVYDDVRYAYSIVPKISHASLTLQWVDETLFLYISGNWTQNLGVAVKILEYDDYEVYRVPDTKENRQLWYELPNHVKDLEMADRHYYMSEGNLLYFDNSLGGEFYVADNAFFDPALLLLPIVLPACIKMWINRKKIWHIDEEET